MATVQLLLIKVLVGEIKASVADSERLWGLWGHDCSNSKKELPNATNAFVSPPNLPIKRLKQRSDSKWTPGNSQRMQQAVMCLGAPCPSEFPCWMPQLSSAPRGMYQHSFPLEAWEGEANVLNTKERIFLEEEQTHQQNVWI